MPSTKKRINLTVSDNLYEKLQVYKEQSGVGNDAAACIQLIVQQLNALEQMKVLTDTIQKMNIEELTKISNEGLGYLKERADRTGKK